MAIVRAMAVSQPIVMVKQYAVAMAIVRPIPMSQPIVMVNNMDVIVMRIQ